jgi:hypothetical protein
MVIILFIFSTRRKCEEESEEKCILVREERRREEGKENVRKDVKKSGKKVQGKSAKVSNIYREEGRARRGV